MIDLLLTGGTVITMDAGRRILADGAVAVDAGRILAAARKAHDDAQRAVRPGSLRDG